MAENRLPSGVGKKIVEALKKQAEIEIQPIPDAVEVTESLISEPQVSSDESYSNISDEISLKEDSFDDFAVENNVEAMLESTFNESDNIEASFEDSFGSELDFGRTEVPIFEEKEIFAQSPMHNVPPQKTYAMPANVAVLKRLIMQLPQGVTKQTGAQIIRQTMEALGISMNSVLKEAQQGQDSITASAKSCMATIAEYKNNIKELEKQVQDYKKQAIALNDLISLFVLTDKH